MKTIGIAGLALVASLTGMSGTGIAQNTELIVIEGCLTPGSRAGFFTLTDDVTGIAVTVTGLADLARHAGNHQERLTGRYAVDGQDEIFRVEGVEYLERRL